jgi:hypothetical protein
VPQAYVLEPDYMEHKPKQILLMASSATVVVHSSCGKYYDTRHIRQSHD